MSLDGFYSVPCQCVEASGKLSGTTLGKGVGGSLSTVETVTCKDIGDLSKQHIDAALTSETAHFPEAERGDGGFRLPSPRG